MTDHANRAAAGLIRAANSFRDDEAFSDALHVHCAGLDATETEHLVKALALSVAFLHQGATLDAVLANLEGGAR